MVQTINLQIWKDVKYFISWWIFIRYIGTPLLGGYIILIYQLDKGKYKIFNNILARQSYKGFTKLSIQATKDKWWTFTLFTR